MAAAGTIAWVRMFVTERNAPGIGGANTRQNTAPVSVIDTVKTNFKIQRMRGIWKGLPLMASAVPIIKYTRHIAAIHILDCIVKYRNTVPLPIALAPEKIALIETPSAAHSTTINCREREKYFFI